MKRHVNIIVLLTLLLAVAGCGSDDKKEAENEAPAYTVVSEATLKAGDDIPVPATEEDILLTVTGKIGNPNQGDSIVMDLKTLEAVGLVEYTLKDPFVTEDITYRGVLMKDLLALWGVPEDAQTLQIVALNDYVADVPLADLRNYPVIFALQANGEYMPIETRGPAMLVYPYHSHDFDSEVYNSYWVWQIKSIDVQ